MSIATENNEPVNVDEPQADIDLLSLDSEQNHVAGGAESHPKTKPDCAEPELKHKPVEHELVHPDSDQEREPVIVDIQPEIEPFNEASEEPIIIELEKDDGNNEPEPTIDPIPHDQPVAQELDSEQDLVNVQLLPKNDEVIKELEPQSDEVIEALEPLNEQVHESFSLDQEMVHDNEHVNVDREPESMKDLFGAEPESDDHAVSAEPDPDDQLVGEGAQHYDEVADTETQPIDEIVDDTDTQPIVHLADEGMVPNNEIFEEETEPNHPIFEAEMQQSNVIFDGEMHQNDNLLYEEKQPKNEVLEPDIHQNINDSEQFMNEEESHNPEMFVESETHNPVIHQYNELENTGMQHYDFVDTEETQNHHHHHQNSNNNQIVSMETQPYSIPENTNIHLNNNLNNELVNIEKRQSDDMANLDMQPNKRRKKKSVVWEHFTIEHVSAGCRRACCKQCKQSFAYSTGSKVAGTSHLKRHIAKGTCPVVLRNQEKNNQLNNNNQLSPYSAPSKLNNNTAGATSAMDTPKRRYRTAAAPYFAFDPERCRFEITRMIIMHDYPLHIVEHPGFVAFVQNLQPRFDMVSFNTVQGDCVAAYLREKVNILKLIEGMPGRICLTLDLWTSCQTVGYVFLTGHFIDSDWKMHRKILSVVMEPYPDSDASFSHAVAACLSDWSIEGRLFSLTINQNLGEAGVDNLRALLSVKNPLILGGQLLIGCCLARALSSIAQDGLRAAYDTVKKVRDSVKYVKTSESHEEKFLELKQHLQVPSTKTLALDDQSTWNTTYEMLLAASELKEVFSCLDTSDPDYKDAPSMEDWKLVETLCTYLKLLFDTASLLTATTVPTTNTFFHEAWKIQLELARAAASEDPFVSNLTRPMQENFDRYWKNTCLILAIAVVMDPRFKMKLVEFSFTKIYNEDASEYIKIVDEGIHELFREYVALPLQLTPAYLDEVNGGGFMRAGEDFGGNGLGLTDFDVYIMETTSQQSKTELDQYLEESLLPRVHEFDVVGWWKLNKVKYPTLSKMARDILSIPVTTVSPDSVFDTTSKEMDRYRCSLKPETVEALICVKDWLHSDSVDNSGALVKMEYPI